MFDVRNNYQPGYQPLGFDAGPLRSYDLSHTQTPDWVNEIKELIKKIGGGGGGGTQPPGAQPPPGTYPPGTSGGQVTPGGAVVPRLTPAQQKSKILEELKRAGASDETLAQNGDPEAAARVAAKRAGGGGASAWDRATWGRGGGHLQDPNDKNSFERDIDPADVRANLAMAASFGGRANMAGSEFGPVGGGSMGVLGPFGGRFGSQGPVVPAFGLEGPTDHLMNNINPITGQPYTFEDMNPTMGGTPGATSGKPTPGIAHLAPPEIPVASMPPSPGQLFKDPRSGQSVWSSSGVLPPTFEWSKPEAPLSPEVQFRNDVRDDRNQERLQGLR
jgi:hypothetical protein